MRSIWAPPRMAENDQKKVSPILYPTVGQALPKDLLEGTVCTSIKGNRVSKKKKFKFCKKEGGGGGYIVSSFSRHR